MRPERAGRPPLVPGEHPVTRDRDLDGDPVVGTERAVYHECGAAGWGRLGWEEVDRVVWEPGSSLLTLTSRRPGRAPGLALRLAAGTRLAALADERVTATTLARTRVRLSARCAAWIAARQCPGTGEVAWVVTVDGADPESDAVLAAIHQLRVQLGV
jgi:hypothetical protein